MKPTTRAFSVVATFALLSALPLAAKGGPPAGEPGQHTLVFRSLEDPGVESHPEACPFPGANLFLGANLWSMQTRASDAAWWTGGAADRHGPAAA